MATINKIEHLFNIIDKSTKYISEQLNKNYLEALIDTTEHLFQKSIVIEVDDEQLEELNRIYQDYDEASFTREEKRRAFQLAVLNGMKEHSIVGTGLTPDAVAMFIGYLAKKFIESPAVIIDPAIGSANLLTCIMNQYNNNIKGFGTEVDSTLVRLAYVNSNFQEHEIDLYHQDGLKSIFAHLADLTVCDLPVGIYPNQKVASNYELFSEEQELYTHHLLIEQSIRLTKEDGYLIFLIPNTIFSEPGADKLRKLITDHTYIQALLQLPETLFQKGSIYKSIFILQKKGPSSNKPTQTLMASLPSFSDQVKFSTVLGQINEWIDKEKR